MTEDQQVIADGLVARVIDALLREDVAGLSRRVRHGTLSIRGWPAIPLVAHDFQQDWIVDRTAAPGLPTLGELFDALAPMVDADRRDGMKLFRDECGNALRNTWFHHSIHGATLRRLGTEPADRMGIGGSTWFDALGAFVDHPVYPTARARVGFGLDDMVRYGPETHPTFELTWIAVPRGRVGRSSTLPTWWPEAGDVGLGAEYQQHELLPVHPSVFRQRDALAQILDDTDLRDVAIPGTKPFLRVVPTLSIRTVAVVDQADHLKLPLLMSTLGNKNRRALNPESLVTGAGVQRLLDAVVEKESNASVLVTDESTHGSAGHSMLGYMVRRHPRSFAGEYVVTVASLLAPTPDGRRVIDLLADECFDGDVPALFDRYLQELFDFNVMLFTKYGIALEAHQQNLALVMKPGRRDLQLLIKDHDSPLINPDIAERRLGPGVTAGVADPRCFSRDIDDLARVFTTITVHLCATAIAMGLGDQRLNGSDPAAFVSSRLSDALERCGESARPLRRFLFDSDRLPRKLMITAGTLLTKEQSGARDVNKHYDDDGPNYLRSTTNLERTSATTLERSL